MLACVLYTLVATFELLARVMRHVLDALQKFNTPKVGTLLHSDMQKVAKLPLYSFFRMAGT